jgi:predicted TIM-barrel fold metal-dependent hydrolase
MINIRCSTVAPVIEAFGSERIIYGSSTSTASRTPANAGDWYEIARESLVETGIEQALIDNIFYANADRVYGKL